MAGGRSARGKSNWNIRFSNSPLSTPLPVHCSSSERERASSSGVKSWNPTCQLFKFQYPSVNIQEGLYPESHDDTKDPILLVDSGATPIVAFFDETLSKEPTNMDIFYDCNSNSILDDRSHKGLGFYDDDTSHKGLGFCDEMETTPTFTESSSIKMHDYQVSPVNFSLIDDEINVDGSFTSKPSINMTENVSKKPLTSVRNSGFISIGGMKLYTQDISDEVECDDNDGESTDSSRQGDSNELYGSESNGSDSLSDLEIDDEVAEDYLEGISGSEDILNAKWLADVDLDSSFRYSFDETAEKLEGMALLEASMDYGMMKPKSTKKSSAKSHKLRTDMGNWVLARDNQFVTKDSRMFSSKKKQVAMIPQSWPSYSRKSKHLRNFQDSSSQHANFGAKKKHRKEIIALKRRERMKNRGVDLERINSKLKKMVLNEVDVLSFESMSSRDCNQVQLLAAIYRLQSGCHGTRKKRIVTVMRTVHTSLPSPTDKVRLKTIIGSRNEDANFTATSKKGTYVPQEHLLASKNRSSKNFGTRHGSGKKKIVEKSVSFADQPVSFVSSGIMQNDVESKTFGSEEKNDANVGNVETSKVGTFELHTNGFGSKMMAKMGFKEGGGLGKDGQGISEPIEVIKRPKSLGLGVEFNQGVKHHNGGSLASKKDGSRLSKGNNSNLGVGAFEKHTKGFGSKMMAKMGFVEGTGLGKDSQGMVNPLVVVRRPKVLGLGHKD